MIQSSVFGATSYINPMVSRETEDLGHSQTRLRGQRPDGLGDYDFKLQVLGSDPTGQRFLAEKMGWLPFFIFP